MALPKGYKFKPSVLKSAQVLVAGELGRLKNTALALQRRKDYNASPNHCLDCGAAILTPVDDMRGRVFAEIKRKKFCNQSCGAKYHNRVLGYPHRKPKVRICSTCGIDYTSPYRKTDRCSDCRSLPRVSVFETRKKSECRIQEVRSHARLMLFRAKERKCEICGYDVRVDCCHVKPVREFSKDALLSEINALENLKALCPNHHVELDLGILKFSVEV
jgi:hypothetical protein